MLKYVFIFLFSFFTLEALVRWKIHYDEDGQSYFFHIPLMPYVLPVKSYLKAAQNWTGAKFENSYLAPSSKLGWDIRPNSLSQNKLYFANLAGQRSSPKSLTKKKKLKKNIRLAIFGGSFLHGDEVSFEESLAALLEKQVPEIEIINFAVPSYGLDQSYLKYLEIKQKEKLDWVVIGIYPAMCERNLNIFKKFEDRNSEIYFSKPRFLYVNSQWQLVNSPPLDFRTIYQVLETFDQSDLKKFETFYDPNHYINKSWQNLKILALIQSFFSNDLLRLWENQQVQNLCLPLLQRFFQKASQNSQVVILFTPPKNFLDKKGLYYKEVKKFFTQIKAHFPFIDPSQNLENKKDIFVTHHYSAQGNQVLALELAQYLKQSEKAKIKTD